jgi:PqqD family protein of HPr-rel-A system
VIDKSSSVWSIAPGQRLLFQDFEDGVVLFDALVGSTHLLDASAAEALAIIEEAPGLDALAIHLELLKRLQLGTEALPLAAVEALLLRFEAMALVSVERA